MFVKHFEAKDWAIYKAIRLEALSRQDDVYGGSFATESIWRDSQWEYVLGRPHQAFFGLYDGANLIGSASVFTDKNDVKGRTALLAGSYIREEYRGRGLSRLLYAARLEWIIKSGRYDRVLVAHKEGNDTSRRANQGLEFGYTGQEEHVWGDGPRGIKMNYEMRIAI